MEIFSTKISNSIGDAVELRGHSGKTTAGYRVSAAKDWQEIIPQKAAAARTVCNTRVHAL